VSKLRSPLPYFGGKFLCLPEILPRLPRNKKKYVEPFGGGATVLLARKHANIEIYNDLDNNVYNFFHVMKFLPLSFCDKLEFLYEVSPQSFDKFKAFVVGQPFLPGYFERESAVAEKHFTGAQLKQMQAILKKKYAFDDVDRAVAFYLTKKLSYASNGKSYQPKPFNLDGCLGDLGQLAGRLRTVAVENRDYKKVSIANDSPDTLTYFDPPYDGAEGVYDVRFTRDDQHDLAEIAGNMQGPVMISQKDTPFVRKLFKNFYLHSFLRDDTIAYKHNKEQKFPELLIATYNMDKVLHENTAQITFNYEEGFEFLCQ